MAKIPSTSTPWSGVWDPTKEFCTGEGFIGIGKIAEVRFHTVTSRSDIIRYNALVVDVTNVFKRTFNKYGNEVEPDWKASNPQGAIPFDELTKILGQNSGHSAPAKLLDANLLSKLHPKVKGRFEFWAEVDLAKKINPEVGVEIIFKTNGASIFVAEVRRTDSAFSRYGEGGKVLSQISKISDSHESSKVLPQDTMEGVADEEWDD